MTSRVSDRMALTGPADPDSTADLVARLVAGRPGRPLVVAVDGASAAGTSTLAGAVGRRLGATVVTGDDFYRDLSDERRRDLSPAEGVEQYFDWQRLREEVLRPLRAGRTARYRPYDWRAGGGLAEHAVELRPTPVIVLDGGYSARPEQGAEVDVAVLVETPREDRHRRLIARGHGDDAWWPRWEAAEDLCFATVRPARSFDLVVAGR